MTSPRGWAQAALGDVCRLLNGRAYKQSELLDRGRWPVLRVGNFFSNPKWYYSDLDLEPDKYCNDGDLLYAWSASFGPRIWTGGKVIYHYHIWKTVPEEAAITKLFLFHWFEWDKENIKADHGTGTTMVHVTKGDMEQRHISIPPLAEQQRIVAKINALSARLARGREELDRVTALAMRLRETALRDAFDRSGADKTTIGCLVTDVRYGTAKKCDYGLGRTPVLRIPNIQGGKIDLTDIKSAEFDAAEHAKLALREGDVLVIRSNGSRDLVGRSAVVGESAVGMLYAGYLIRLRPDLQSIRPAYLNYYLSSPIARAEVENCARSTSGVNNVNAQQLRALSVPTPSLAEQDAVVGHLDGLIARADRLEAFAVRARKLLDRLEATILAKAFRGELVPQDPNDQPASVALEQVCAQRAAAPPRNRACQARELAQV